MHPRPPLQLGRRTCSLLDAHQQRFVFSPLGALRWKRDLAEYAALGARLRSPPARRHLDDMQVGAGWLGLGLGLEVRCRSSKKTSGWKGEAGGLQLFWEGMLWDLPSRAMLKVVVFSIKACGGWLCIVQSMSFHPPWQQN